MSTLKRMKVRRWRPEDIPAIVACHRSAYPDYPEDGGYYHARTYELELATFPEGQFLVEADGQVVGYATSLIVQLEDEVTYTYEEITGAGAFSNHNPAGDTLYGADIGVRPDYRGLGVSQLLYEQRKKLLGRYNLRRMVAYGRLPGYSDYGGIITVQEYIDLILQGKLRDPALNAHLRAGYTVKKVLLDFVWDDASLNYCTFLEMPNPTYKPEKRRIASAPIRRPVRKIRVCAAQYLLRPVESWAAFEQNVEFFVSRADTHHCHFLALPELFTMQLFALQPARLDAKSYIEAVAELTEGYIELFTRLAMKYRIYIIGGSQPVRREDKLRNVAHLFTPTGHVYTQDKLHIMPSERRAWDIRPGQGLQVFETPLARIAVQISYDIEFPEVARLLTRAGAQVIFVPSSTEGPQAYHRVRTTAQARAIENEVYVVLSAVVGNLPNHSNLINYGQTAIFTPSDHAFPPRAIAGEADPNLENVVIADLDLTDLSHHREQGSTRPLYDRRTDLYELRAKSPVKIIRTE